MRRPPAGLRELLLFVACLVASGLFAAATPTFATADNLMTVMRNSNELMLVSLGTTLLLAMGGVDVSVGMVMGLAAIAVGQALLAGWPPVLAVLAGLLTGAVLGLVTASVVVLGRIPAIVGTLGLLGHLPAAIFLILGGSWLSGLPAGLTEQLGARIAGIPVAALVIGAAYACIWAMLRRMPYGLHLLSIGNGEERARLSGIAVTRTRFLTFVLNGILCGIAAAFYVATYRNVATTIGGTLALEAIAAAVLGGTSVTAGSCSLLGTALGVVLLRLVQNGLLLVGVPSLWQSVVTGGLLLAVLGLEVIQGRLILGRAMVAGRDTAMTFMAWRGRSPVLAILCALWIVVVAGLLVLKPSALAVSTLTTVLQFSTLLALAALGQSLVVLCGGAGIDLSVGGIASLAAILPLLLAKAGLTPWLIPAACLATGATLGLFNGWLVSRLRILPLIATLGTFYAYSGLALALTNGAAQNGVPPWLIVWGRGLVDGIPLPFLTLTLPAFVLVAVLLAFTSWGRWIYALGHNEGSARLIGLPVDRVRRLAYTGSGLLAGAAGLVSLAWLGSGRPNIGQNLELTSLTAAMLGGISIFGGRGGVVGVLAAVLLLVTLQTGLLQLNVNSIWQVGIVGALLIAVLLVDRYAGGRR